LSPLPLKACGISLPHWPGVDSRTEEEAKFLEFGFLTGAPHVLLFTLRRRQGASFFLRRRQAGFFARPRSLDHAQRQILALPLFCPGSGHRPLWTKASMAFLLSRGTAKTSTLFYLGEIPCATYRSPPLGEGGFPPFRLLLSCPLFENPPSVDYRVKGGAGVLPAAIVCLVFIFFFFFVFFLRQAGQGHSRVLGGCFAALPETTLPHG